MPGSRNEDLKDARRQFFHYRFVENLSIPRVREAMDNLSLDLVQATGQSFFATYVFVTGSVVQY